MHYRSSGRSTTAKKRAHTSTSCACEKQTLRRCWSSSLSSTLPSSSSSLLSSSSPPLANLRESVETFSQRLGFGNNLGNSLHLLCWACLFVRLFFVFVFYVCACACTYVRACVCN